MSLDPADTAQINAVEPPEMTLLRETGWNFKKGDACKSIDGIEVGINYSRIAEKHNAVTVDGLVYVFGKNDLIDEELASLFKSIAQHPKKPKEKFKPKEEHNSVTQGQTYTAAKPEPKQPEPVNENKPEASRTILDYIKSFVNDDVLEIFGDSGTGKSKFAIEVARQTLASGKTVFYLDTERNLSADEVKKLKGCHYKYTPLISEIGQLTRQLPKVDLVIIDSIGFPILTAYARMNMKQKGDALLNMIAIFGDLKEWAYRNNGIAIVINQPESDFNKEPGHLIRPFGDKSQFAAKEIWKTEVTQRGSVTKTDIQAFRSRSVGHKTLIAKMEVSDSGTQIKAVIG